jgi:hypothetical protein
MKKRISGLLVTLALVVGVTVSVQAPAHASFDWCHGSSVVCFAEHTYGNGARWGPRSFPYGGCVNVPSYLNDKIDSLWNKYGWDSQSPPLQLTGYENACHQSVSVLYTWGPNAYVNNIGVVNRNRISSVCVGPRITGYCR